MTSDIPSSSCYASDRKMNFCCFLSLDPAPKTLATLTNQYLNRNQNLNLPHFHPLKLPRSVALPPLRSTSAVQSAQLAPHFGHSSAVRCSAGEAAGDPQKSKDEGHSSSSGSFWSKWKMDSAEMRSRVGKLGLAAVLAYGLFDGVTYTTFFVLAFLGYEKSTGKNPAANLQALLGIVLLMWTGNNVTRPFRVAGAAALAPVIDKGLRRIQKSLNLPSQILTFALVASMVAASCLTVVGLLILSRWGK